MKKLEEYDTLTLEDGTVIDMKKLIADQRLALAGLNNLLPHIGILGEQLRFIYTFEVATQATDGYNVFVNPEFTNNLSMEGKIFVMAHELIHCLLNHIRRAKAIGAMNQKGNVAADYEVNQLLVDMGLNTESFVKNTIRGFIDSKWRQIGFEEIYAKIPDEKTQPPKGAPQNDSNNQGQGQGQSQDQNKGQGSSQNSSGKQSKQNQGSPTDSSETGGNKNISNTERYQHGGQGSVNGDDMRSRVEGDQMAENAGYEKEGGTEEAVGKQWEKTANELASKLPGDKPGYAQLKNLILKQKVKDDGTWRKRLQQIVGRSISMQDTRRNFTHQNTLASQNRVAPTEFANFNNLDYVTCFVDTSGSMTEEFLKGCLMEVMKVADAKKPNGIIVGQFDTKIQDLQVYKSAVEFKRKFHMTKLKGGGGTDIKDVFDLPKSKRKDWPRSIPELLLVFTDGYLEQYKRPNLLCKNLVWCVVDNPSFELKYKEPGTHLIYIPKEAIEKYK